MSENILSTHLKTDKQLLKGMIISQDKRDYPVKTCQKQLMSKLLEALLPAELHSLPFSKTIAHS
jgi:hypothetical protein